jgi:hypothetical protein
LALAFTPRPNKKELSTALLSIAFSLLLIWQFCWFYIHNTAAIKELSRRYFKIYMLQFINIRLYVSNMENLDQEPKSQSQPEIFIFSEPRFLSWRNAWRKGSSPRPIFFR